MTRPLRITLLLLSLAALGLSAPADAQIRASERAIMMQTIDGTEITMEYYRPRTRGRSPLFGVDATVWEKVWTPGANWATTIEFEKPITIDGTEVAPGTYSLWIEMADADFMPETLIFDLEERIFHLSPPPVREGQIRFPVTGSEGDFLELLTWGFDDLRSDGGTLSLRWGTYRAAFDIGVEPSMRMTVTPEEAAPIVGRYEMEMFGPNGEVFPTFTFAVEYRDDETLRGDLIGVGDPFMEAMDMQLLPFAEAIFAPGEFYDGQLQEVWEGFFFEFDLVDGVAVEFTLRGEEDEIVGRGRRER